jgi:hypothetical protein
MRQATTEYQTNQGFVSENLRERVGASQTRIGRPISVTVKVPDEFSVLFLSWNEFWFWTHQRHNLCGWRRTIRGRRPGRRRGGGRPRRKPISCYRMFIELDPQKLPVITLQHEHKANNWTLFLSAQQISTQLFYNIVFRYVVVFNTVYVLL